MTSVSVSDAISMPSAASLARSSAGVLDDAVVDDGDVARGVGVGVGVAVGGLAVGGPARVADADGALQPLGQGGDQVVDAPGPLVDLEARRAQRRRRPAES